VYRSCRTKSGRFAAEFGVNNAHSMMTYAARLRRLTAEPAGRRAGRD